tara:strand:+ start:61 stop:438 length:378 start_codon:yes stop_codon:yes gene_type:complete
MKNILIILFVFSASITFGQTNTEFTESEIISEVEYSTPCGYYEFAIRIKVLVKKSNSNYQKDDQFDLIIPCPESYGSDFFEKTENYLIKFDKNFPTDYRPLVVSYDSQFNHIINSDFFVNEIKKN